MGAEKGVSWGQQTSSNLHKKKKKGVFVKHETITVLCLKVGRGKESDRLFYKEIWKVVGDAEVLLLGLENIQNLLLEIWQHRIAIWRGTVVFVRCMNKGGRLLKRRPRQGDASELEGRAVRSSNGERPPFRVAQTRSLAQIGMPRHPSLRSQPPRLSGERRVSLVNFFYTPFSPEHIPTGSAPGVNLRRCAQTLMDSPD